MIPDHLIDKAVHAAINTPIYGDDDPKRERLDDMHPEDAQAWLDTTRAAIEAVAADIWEQGWDVGRRFQGPNSNPYRASETA